MAESPEHFDLVVVGTGSGNSVLTPDFDDWRVALIERDVFGGTCLNRGILEMWVPPLAKLAQDSGELRRSRCPNRPFGTVHPKADISAPDTVSTAAPCRKI